MTDGDQTSEVGSQKAPFSEWLREVQRIAIEKHDFTRVGITRYMTDSIGTWQRYYQRQVSPEDALKEELRS